MTATTTTAPVRLTLLLTALAAVSAAAVIGLLSSMYALPLLAVLVAAMPAAARPIRWSARTAAVSAGILLCYGWLVGVLLAAPYLKLTAAAAQPIGLSFQLAATLAIALPLAMPGAAGAPRVELRRRDLVLSIATVFVLTDAYLAGNTFLVLALGAVSLPVVLIALRIRRDFELRWWRHPASTVRVAAALTCCALLALSARTGAYDVLGPAWPTVVVAGAIVLAALGLLPRRSPSPAITTLLALIAALLALDVATVYRSPGEAVTLSAPLTGEWYVVHGGHSELVNYHHNSPSQREAYDILQVRDGATHRDGAPGLAAYYGFDQPLLAPADGVVARVRTDLADRPAGSPDPEPANATGNVIVLDIGGGRYVLLAHLEQGSILVSVGDRVRAGQPIARVGNSGNTDEPHLHIQAQNSPRPDVERGGVTSFPIVFRNVVTARTAENEPADLRRGDHFQTAA